MITFVALYRGESAAAAELLAVSDNVQIVSGVARALLASQPAPNADPILGAQRDGERAALSLIAEADAV
jgi:hypothetical protein